MKILSDFWGKRTKSVNSGADTSGTAGNPVESGEKGKDVPKTQVFNVIILDRSGSMEYIRRAAVDGFNETLAGIRKAQEEYADTQEHFVSLVTFCGCSIKYMFDKVPVEAASPLRMEDYEPCCRTPLYDAMGFTMTSIRDHVKALADAAVVVTIITDGEENASKEYSGKHIKSLVEKLRAEGWSITYMGANQDAVEVAAQLSIRNARNFGYSDEETLASMQQDAGTRSNFFRRLARFKHSEQFMDQPLSAEERCACYARMGDAAFDEEEDQ